MSSSVHLTCHAPYIDGVRRPSSARRAHCAKSRRRSSGPARALLPSDFLQCQICQVAQPGEIGWCQRTRARVDDTQTANACSIIENKWIASVEPNSGLIRDQGAVSKACIQKCVLNNQRLTVMHYMGAQCGVARCFLHVEAMARLEPLTVFVDQTDKCNWYIEERGGEACDSIEPVLWLGIEDSQRAKRR